MHRKGSKSHLFHLWCWKRSGSSGLWWGPWSSGASCCGDVALRHRLAAGWRAAACLWQSPTRSRHSPGSLEDSSRYPIPLVLMNSETGRAGKQWASIKMKEGRFSGGVLERVNLTNRKPVLVVVVVLQTVTLWHHLQLAGDIVAATNVWELWKKAQICVWWLNYSK